MRPRVGVERRERLVEQKDRGIPRERAGEGDPLTLPARDRRRPGIGEMADPEAVEQLARTSAAPELHVGADAQVRKQGVLLKHETDASALGRNVDSGRCVEPALVAETHHAAVGPEQPRDRAEHARLARPGRADERDGLDAELER